MDIKEIQNLIKFVAKSGAYEVEIEKKDFKITIKTSNRGKKRSSKTFEPIVTDGNPITDPVSINETINQEVIIDDKPSDIDNNQNYITVKSPMIGTFYRSPNPESDPFVSEGDSIKVGQTICIVEAMKLFNDIESEVSGKIVKILVDDNSPVEFDQPLFEIDPS